MLTKRCAISVVYLVYSKFVLRGWPHRLHESCIPYRGGFSKGDRFEFEFKLVLR